MRTKTTNKIENLTPDTLKAARIRLGFNQAEMAQSLRTPYRTYQEWENGGRRIPGIATVAVEYLERKDALVMMRVQEKIDQGYKG